MSSTCQEISRRELLKTCSIMTLHKIHNVRMLEEEKSRTRGITFLASEKDKKSSTPSKLSKSLSSSSKNGNKETYMV